MDDTCDTCKYLSCSLLSLVDALLSVPFGLEKCVCVSIGKQTKSKDDRVAKSPRLEAIPFRLKAIAGWCFSHEE